MVQILFNQLLFNCNWDKYIFVGIIKGYLRLNNRTVFLVEVILWKVSCSTAALVTSQKISPKSKEIHAANDLKIEL